MANTHENLASLFTGIADSIRSKTGGTDEIVADNFPSEIDSIEAASELAPELSDQDSIITELSAILDTKASVPAEDLDTEMTEQGEIITTQDDLISQITTALAGKTGADGGIEVEVGSLDFDATFNAFTCVVVTTLENNENVTKEYVANGFTSSYLTIDNVVIGSPIFMVLADNFESGDITGLEVFYENMANSITIFAGKITEASASVSFTYFDDQV